MEPDAIRPVRSLFVSPHFDDVALSCGGTVAREARDGRALVVTVFAGEPADTLTSFAEFQHRRWGALDDAVATRRREDRAAMEALGADYHWLDFPDAIYRGDLYRSDEDLFGSVKAPDEPLQQTIAAALQSLVERARPRSVYLPLGVGRHVDHQICFSLSSKIASTERVVFYYEDFPYAAESGAVERRVEEVGLSQATVAVDVSSTIDRRLAAIECYASQLATIFRHHGEFRGVVRRYAKSIGGPIYAERFWQRPFP